MQDRKHRIFVRKQTVTPIGEFEISSARSPGPDAVPRRMAPPIVALDLRREAETALLAHYAPPALIVDSDLHIKHIQGDTSAYMALAAGTPSFHLLKMLRSELMVDLRTAIDEAKKRGVAVQRDRVEFDLQGEPAAVRLEVRPLGIRNSKQDLLVVFQKLEAERPPAISTRGPNKSAERRISDQKHERMTRELAATRQHLQALIAEQESAQEEMKVVNEEILSSNEELQSTNEELETAKEELQSSNEELVTLNHELQHHNSELAVVTHDLNNLLVGVDIPVLLLDAGLRVRRFTPVAGTLLNLIPADVGRPFSNIASNLEVSNWPELFSEVLGRGRLVEREVTDRSGHRYSLRLRPYKTGDNQIEGVLLVMLDTDVIYRARDEARKASEYASAIVETIREPLVVVDSGWRILTAYRCFYGLFHMSPPSKERESFFGLVRLRMERTAVARIAGGYPVEGVADRRPQTRSRFSGDRPAASVTQRPPDQYHAHHPHCDRGRHRAPACAGIRTGSRKRGASSGGQPRDGSGRGAPESVARVARPDLPAVGFACHRYWGTGGRFAVVRGCLTAPEIAAGTRGQGVGGDAPYRLRIASLGSR